jgi:hypothetical protein
MEAKMKEEMKVEKQKYVSPKMKKLEFDYEDVILMSAGNGDVDQGRGRGGGCDGVPYHRNARTFSSGRFSIC